MKQQPGVMLYFDVRESIAQLSYEEKGMLLDAILDYGQKRQEPEFAGGGLCFIWPFVRRDIHRDSERYEEIRSKRRAAAAKRWQAEEEPMQEDAHASKCMHVECKPMQNMPTTPAPSPTSSAAAAPPTAAAASETTPPAEIDRRRADAIARLRAMPGS